MVITEKIDVFFKDFPLQSFNAKDIILKPHRKIENIFYLREGFVREFSSTLEADEATLHIFIPGTFFPINNILSDIENNYYFEAFVNIKVNIADVDSVVTFLKNNPDISYHMLKQFAAALTKILSRTESLLYRDAYYKVISLFIYLGDKFNSDIDTFTKIIIPLTHTDIASWLGLQRETTSRQIEVLENKKLIINSSHYFFVNLEKLKKELYEYEFQKLKN